MSYIATDANGNVLVFSQGPHAAAPTFAVSTNPEPERVVRFKSREDGERYLHAVVESCNLAGIHRSFPEGTLTLKEDA